MPQTSGIQLGRRVFGLAAILFGVVTLVWHDFNLWQQIQALGHVPHREILACSVGGLEILGGLAIQWSMTARAAAVLLGVIYLTFALLWIPRIIAHPLVYDGWGNFFEQFSQVSGALVLFGWLGNASGKRGTGTPRLGVAFLGVCAISFTLDQIFSLSATASFVPKWIPPGQMFWAITTTAAFAAAAVALLSGHSAPLAARLLTVMIVGFGALIWVPRVFAAPHLQFNWAANAENFSIAGAVWIVADFLNRTRFTDGAPESAFTERPSAILDGQPRNLASVREN